jgi:ceramide glucosyltransferase
VLVTAIFSAFALLSVALLLWQFVAALRFPLHRRVTVDSFAPAISVLKPLKGCDEHTAACLRSWLAQKHGGAVQVLFGVAEQTDPVCDVVRGLLQEFPDVDASLVITPEALGMNAKISTVAQLMRSAKHEVLCLSDADVRVPGNFLAHAVAPLHDSSVGLVNCFYQLANPTTWAMRWEAIAINADFWSQVLQSNTLKRQDFALGAVMLLRRETLAQIGGFESLLDYLADDYHLGRRVTATGARIELSPIVVECWDKPRDFAAVWNHQLRWARTIRACQPVPYFFSILSNVTLWAGLLAVFGDFGRFPPDSVVYDDRAPDWLAAMELFQVPLAFFAASLALSLRCLIAARLHMRLTQRRDIFGYWWLAPVKDLLQAGIWAASFLGNTVEWQGKKFTLRRDGKLMPR